MLGRNAGQFLCPFSREEECAIAANRIKGITVEIGGDTTKLQTALQGVNKEIKSTQSQLKDVEKLLKLDPGNTELLAQKEKFLSDAVKETKEKLEALLEQNAEQRETLHKLMAQGYIDQILFTQENNVLLTQANDFRSDIEALNRSVTGDTSKVYETERLIHFCERSEMLLEYSEDLFELFVDHIEVYSRQSIGFVLHCGLTFKERS